MTQELFDVSCACVLSCGVLCIPMLPAAKSSAIDSYFFMWDTHLGCEIQVVASGAQ
jgi:hypothetical protein